MPIWQPVPMPCLMAGLTLAIIFTRFEFNMKIPMLAALFIMRNILAFAERARSAWLRCLGIDQPAMLADDGLGFVVRRIELIFIFLPVLVIFLMLKAACFGLGGASLKLQQKIINRENRHILARLIVDIGLVTLTDGTRPKICRLPAAVKAKFSNLALSDG